MCSAMRHFAPPVYYRIRRANSPYMIPALLPFLLNVYTGLFLQLILASFSSSSGNLAALLILLPFSNSSWSSA